MGDSYGPCGYVEVIALGNLNLCILCELQLKTPIHANLGGRVWGTVKAPVTSSVRVSVGVVTLEHEHLLSVPLAKMFLPGDYPAALLSSSAVFLHPVQGRHFSIKSFNVKNLGLIIIRERKKKQGPGEFR